MRLPLKQRLAFWGPLEMGRLSVSDSGVVFTPSNQPPIPIPIGTIGALLIGPGVSVSHEVVKVLSQTSTHLFWVGEEGVHLYGVGFPDRARTDRKTRQIQASLDPQETLRIATHMVERRFGPLPSPPEGLATLRGMEGSLVRTRYGELARQIGIEWPGRDPKRVDPINQGLNQAHHHLYSVTEVAIRTAHLDPSFGFLHRGNGRSFVFDIADLVKLTTTVPLVFRLCREDRGTKRNIRIECRDMFRRENLLDRLIQLSLEVLGC